VEGVWKHSGAEKMEKNWLSPASDGHEQLLFLMIVPGLSPA
jgi:hypothetical protein